jgi:ABC-2 type transport system permease protein
MRSFFTNPLIVKELRERFRMSRTAWIVGIYLFVIGAILLGFMYLNEMNRSDSIPLGDGHDFFMAMAYLQYAGKTNVEYPVDH